MVLPSKIPQLGDLDLLLSVEQYGSVGKAAQAHSMSQPAASIRLSAMERRLGIRLLERSSSGSRLTEEGEILAKYAHNVMDAMRELMERGSAFRSSDAKRLRVACTPIVSEHLIPEWLNFASFSLGDAHIEVRTGSVDAIYDMIRTSEVDLAFVDGWSQITIHSQKQFPSDLVTQYVTEDELALIVGPKHPWASRARPLTTQELGSAQFVLRERGSGVREYADELLGIAHASQSYIEFPSSAAIKQAVATSQRATILNISTVRSELSEGRLQRVAVDHEMPVKPIYAAWSERRDLPAYARELVDIARSRGGPTEKALPVRPAQRDHVMEVNTKATV